ncbi:MAG TPA: hypothetical protein VF066_10415, partial [Thermoleophilaceae bacterium]
MRQEPGEASERRGSRKRRNERRQLARLPPEPGLERRAQLARPKVRPDPAPTPDAPIAVRERLLDRLALRPASRLGLEESHPRLVDRLPGRCRGHREDHRDLVVAQAAELTQQQRAPLAFRQCSQVGAQRGDTLAQLERFLEAGRGDDGGLVERAVGPAPSREADRLVVGDPKEPRAQRRLRLGAPKGLPRLRHRVVKGVTRVIRVPEDRAAVAIQRLVMALVDRPERLRVPTRRHRTQRVVAALNEPPSSR